MGTEYLTMTVATFIAWLLSTGVSAAVAYVLEFFPKDERLAPIKNVISIVAILVLSAFVSYVASLIPPALLDQTLVQAVVYLFALAANGAGVYFGKIKATTQKLQMYNLADTAATSSPDRDKIERSINPYGLHLGD